MGQARQRQSDSLITGFTWGIILPLIILLLIYFIRYSEIPLTRFVANLQEMKLLFKILSLCGFANLAVFFLFYRKRMDKAAKGIIMATFVYGILVLFSRLL
jgi:hypothetical protein